MSKKTLLNETTIRQFMKYANIGGLADNFINETYVQEEEEPLDEIAPLAAGGLGAMAGKMMDEEEPEMAPMDDDLPADEFGDEELADEEVPFADEEPEVEELPPEAVGALEKAVEAAADAMLDALAPYGVEGEASVEGEEELDLAPEEEPVPEFPEDEGPEDEGLEDEVLDEVEVVDEEAVVNETVKRVMKRLAEIKQQKADEKEKDKIIESVADAIVARLSAKK